MKLDQDTPAMRRGKEPAMERPYSVVLADGHLMVRQGVKRIIEAMNGFEVVGEAGNGGQLLEVMKNQVPDMVIVDISMPSLRDLEAIRKIKAIYADIKIVFLSMYEHKEYLDYALSNGAEGFVIKQNVDLELYPAIEKIRGGETYISPLAG
jgi:DNA-binding NarL/FixJ family response regulator